MWGRICECEQLNWGKLYKKLFHFDVGGGSREHSEPEG